MYLFAVFILISVLSLLLVVCDVNLHYEQYNDVDNTLDVDNDFDDQLRRIFGENEASKGIDGNNKFIVNNIITPFEIIC
jgi:hypothetical protein